jgi:HK97 family phage prohead protease
VKRSLRGLYVIRGGAVSPSLVNINQAVADELTRAKKDSEEAPAEDSLGTLEVNFSKYNEWYRIDSFWEGTFLERVAPGAFTKTFKERGDQIKILFNHGMDPTAGDLLISDPAEYGDRKESPYLAGPLYDTSVGRNLLPGLKRGAYGSSFMFEVLEESWDNEPEKSEHNPDGLPERTIRQNRTFEAGPVTWPANPGATAGMRSGVDWYAEQIRSRDTDRYDDLVRSFTAFRTLNSLTTPRAGQDQRPDTDPPSPGQGRHVSGMSQSARQRRLTLLTMGNR